MKNALAGNQKANRCGGDLRRGGFAGPSIQMRSGWRRLKAAELGEEDGFAFLRKSHGGCGAPPAPRQEPPFESILK